MFFSCHSTSGGWSGPGERRWRRWWVGWRPSRTSWPRPRTESSVSSPYPLRWPTSRTLSNGSATGRRIAPRHSNSGRMCDPCRSPRSSPATRAPRHAPNSNSTWISITSWEILSGATQTRSRRSFSAPRERPPHRLVDFLRHCETRALRGTRFHFTVAISICNLFLFIRTYVKHTYARIHTHTYVHRYVRTYHYFVFQKPL